MRALDTNIIVRLVARDDGAQVASAEALLSAPFLILPTVILEAVWVLRTTYALSPSEIVDRLGRVLGNEYAVVQSGRAILWAFRRYCEGADFADMLHIALANEAEAKSFATFDRRMAHADISGLTIAFEQLV